MLTHAMGMLIINHEKEKSEVDCLYLDVFNPLLQENLNATSNSTKQLIQERQILNSVFIEEVI